MVTAPDDGIHRTNRTGIRGDLITVLHTIRLERNGHRKALHPNRPDLRHDCVQVRPLDTGIDAVHPAGGKECGEEFGTPAVPAGVADDRIETVQGHALRSQETLSHCLPFASLHPGLLQKCDKRSRRHRGMPLPDECHNPVDCLLRRDGAGIDAEVCCPPIQRQTGRPDGSYLLSERKTGQRRAVAARNARNKHGCLCIKKHRHTAGAQCLHILASENGTAAGCNHHTVRRQGVYRLCFNVTERSFAPFGKDDRDGDTLRFLHNRIRVDEPAPQCFCKESTNGGLAAAARSDENDPHISPPSRSASQNPG